MFSGLTIYDLKKCEYTYRMINYVAYTLNIEGVSGI